MEEQVTAHPFVFVAFGLLYLIKPETLRTIIYLRLRQGALHF